MKNLLALILLCLSTTAVAQETGPLYINIEKPSTTENGSDISTVGLGGYWIVAQHTDTDETHARYITDPDILAYTFPALAVGEWDTQITAYDAIGCEGIPSEVRTVEVMPVRDPISAIVFSASSSGIEAKDPDGMCEDLDECEVVGN